MACLPGVGQLRFFGQAEKGRNGEDTAGPHIVVYCIIHRSNTARTYLCNFPPLYLSYPWIAGHLTNQKINERLSTAFIVQRLASSFSVGPERIRY